MRVEVMPKSPKEIPYNFQEILFLYDWNEYQQWITRDIPIRDKLRDKLLKISGYLNQKKGTYYNQYKQHYPEVKYAGHLIKNDKFNKEFIIYEKFRLSHKFLRGETPVSHTEFLGAYSQLSEIFSEKFFRRFDWLCEKNVIAIKRRDTIYKICVDLCAINHENSEVHFYEVKKYKLKGRREEINPDQLLFLAFVTHPGLCRNNCL
jgi:hypothetical protein